MRITTNGGPTRCHKCLRTKQEAIAEHVQQQRGCCHGCPFRNDIEAALRGRVYQPRQQTPRYVAIATTPKRKFFLLRWRDNIVQSYRNFCASVIQCYLSVRNFIRTFLYWWMLIWHYLGYVALLCSLGGIGYFLWDMLAN